MWVCKPNAGLNIISLPLKGEAGDLEREKKNKTKKKHIGGRKGYSSSQKNCELMFRHGH